MRYPACSLDGGPALVLPVLFSSLPLPAPTAAGTGGGRNINSLMPPKLSSKGGEIIHLPLNWGFCYYVAELRYICASERN